ncbi:hypothetical protein ACTFIZ_010911 [Dictyostelium cf. discoideum]
MTAVDNTKTNSIQLNPKNRKEIGELIAQFKNSFDGTSKTREEIKEYTSLIKKQYREDKRKLRLENKSQSGSFKTTEQSVTTTNSIQIPIQVPSVTSTTSTTDSTNDIDEQSVTTKNSTQIQIQIPSDTSITTTPTNEGNEQSVATTNSIQIPIQVPSVTSTTCSTSSTNDSEEQSFTTTNPTHTQIQIPSDTSITTTSTNESDDVRKSIKKSRELIRKLKKSSKIPKSRKEIDSIQEKTQQLNLNEIKNTKSENVKQNTKKTYRHHFRGNDCKTNLNSQVENNVKPTKLEKLNIKKEMLLRKLSIVENKIETLKKSQSTTVSL